MTATHLSGRAHSTDEKAIWWKHAHTHIQYLLTHSLNRLEEKAAVKRKENMKARVDRPRPGASWMLSTTPRAPSNPQRLIFMSILRSVSAATPPASAAGRNESTIQCSFLSVCDAKLKRSQVSLTTLW